MESTEKIIETTGGKRKRQKGITTVEYAILIVVIALAVAASGPKLADGISGVFDDAVAAFK